MAIHQQFSLCWNNYVKTITNAFDKLRCDEDLVDVTLSCEGKRIRAHKMLLSACSTYFKELFKENPCQHPVIIFRNVKHEDLMSLIEFMYKGEVNVSQDQLSSFLMTAEMLAVEGLSGGNVKDGNIGNEVQEIPPPMELEPETEPSDAVWQEKENHRPSVAGISAASQAHYFVEKRNSKSPPAAKRRKWRPNTPTKEVKHETVLTVPDDDCNSDPIEITEPLVRQDMKLEAMKFEAPPNDEVYVDSNLEINCPVKSERDQLQAVSQLLGHDLTDMYSGSSQDSTHQQPSENIPLDINQMLQKAGPSSVDNQAQDLMQGNKSLLRSALTVEARCLASKQEPTLYCCESCPKRFKNPSSLKLHFKMHTGETQCPVCGSVMSRTYELRMHMKKRHNLYM